MDNVCRTKFRVFQIFCSAISENFSPHEICISRICPIQHTASKSISKLLKAPLGPKFTLVKVNRMKNTDPSHDYVANSIQPWLCPWVCVNVCVCPGLVDPSAVVQTRRASNVPHGRRLSSLTNQSLSPAVSPPAMSPTETFATYPGGQVRAISIV